MKYSVRSLLIATLAVCLVSAAIGMWLKPLPDPSYPVVKYHGKTATSVLEELGDPASVTTFPISQAYGEFRVGLFNFYPDFAGVDADVMIRECTWDQWRYRLTLWFHQEGGEWRVLDSCRYHEDVKF